MDTHDASHSNSPAHALVVLPPTDREGNHPWQPILSVSNQVVLYNPTSHALSVRSQTALPQSTCPYCHRPLELSDVQEETPFETHARAQNYFQLLEISNETSSRPQTGLRSVSDAGDSQPPDRSESNGPSATQEHGFMAEAMAEGYFKAFFKEEYRLGMGANGSVFLCQHVLDGNSLGHFAVKKIAVGQSHSYLLQILREVRLLETLRHPNIITYHHAWLESCQFSSFGPRVPTLFVLMQWAEGGSLDDFIDSRLGHPNVHGPHEHADSGSIATDLNTVRSRSDRIRAFRAARNLPKEERERKRGERLRGCTTAVHLLSPEELKSLFEDVVAGLSFLHDRSILHLDLKPGNVLLTWDEGMLIPRAMLSDFGTSQDMIQPARHRSGNTGTLEYAAPESLPSPETGLLAQVDSKADMWSLGMILHMLLFFRLPYRYSSDGEGRSGDGGDMARLEKEVSNYSGFRSTPTMASTFASRGVSQAYLLLLESLLNRTAVQRPSSERVLRVIREGNLDPLPLESRTDAAHGTLIARMAPLIPSPPPLHEAAFQDPDVRVDDSVDVPTSEDHAISEDSVPTPLDEHVPRNDKVPLLTFHPPPPRPATVVSPPAVFPSWPWVWHLLDIGPTPISRIQLVRAVKSCILVAKILSLQSMCTDSRPEPVFLCFIVLIAIIDTCFDGLWSTMLLGLSHVAILRSNCGRGRCCV
ncbi:kinase-like protein [Rickenella mellea]|uniref:non-specific serine/threonine protein kinase n=1 Tax=Rickenella mellea TaxID=50990 RepID=A0A4Y7PLL9_9AGAM|nr:kinase-like protein [Rickenella mellea]